MLIIGVGCNAVVVGHGATWFLVFGDPTRSDYLVSAGGYGAGAAVLVLAAIGVTGLGGPRRAGYTSWILAAVLGALALRASVIAAGLPDDSRWNSPLDGAGGVLLVPLAWPLMVAGIMGGWQLANRRARVAARPARRQDGWS